MSYSHTAVSDEIKESRVDLGGSVSDEATANKLHLGCGSRNKLDLGSVSDKARARKLHLGCGSKNKLDFAPLDAFLESPWAQNQSYLSEVKFLREYLKDPRPLLVGGHDLSKKVESMFRKTVSIISEYDLCNITPQAASELMIRLSEGILEQSNRWVSDVRWFYDERKQYALKPSRDDYYPRTDQLGFVNHLVENLVQLVKHKTHSIGLLKPNISKLQQKLQDMSCMLMEIPQLRKEDPVIKDVIQSFTSMAYKVEDTIDLYLVGDTPIWFTKFSLDDILKELDMTESEIQVASGSVESIIRDIMKSHWPEPYIIPIFHKPQDLDDIISKGSGISDKVHEFFYDSKLKSAFYRRTWCLVSSYKERKKEVFRQLLDNAERWYEGRAHKGVTSDMSEAKLKREVNKFLSGCSHVVILEDVRDVDTLIDIVSALPSRGGRVLVITSSIEVVTKCRYFYKGDILNGRAGDQTSQTNKPITDDDVVGFGTETERMRERLIGESRQLCIISIVGMAGQGKSTPAMKLYNDPLIVNCFDTHMWCYVSLVYEKRGLLLELLGQVIQLSKIIFDKNDEELAEMLHKHLKGRRFLVLLDDVWTVDVWNNLRRCFPNDNNGSRIIFTTRIQELASQAKSGSIVQQLCPLSHDESWELLKKKVFQEESCPQDLLGIGKKIAKVCSGLPLSVVLVAGILKKMEKDIGQWEHISSALSSHILNDAGRHGKGIIEMSYAHLPDHLRSCFLYLGAFMEDKAVPVSKLIGLWIAEKFIKCTDLKSLEDMAEDYLADLIGRSLVIVAQEKSKGGVKLCRVHDLLHEFCFHKAKEENFLQRMNGYDKRFSSSRVQLRRICVHSRRDQFFALNASKTSVRSLLFFATSDLRLSYSYDISFIFRKFKLVTVLDLEDIRVGDSFEKINLLVLLRYLAIQCYVDSIPSSIANLWNLETFIFKGLSCKTVKVPDSIWDMAKLRHLHVRDNASFDWVCNRPQMSFIMHNLQTFSTLSLAYGGDMEKVLRRLTAIRKLKCIFFDSWDDVENCNMLPQLGNLNQLVSLRICYNGEVKYPYKFNLPSNLKKLTLSNFHMPWNEILQLSALDNLEVLKLESNAFDGEKWEMEDEVFPKLKFLKLENLNLVKWSADGDNFPHLQHLVLLKCQHLGEIPPSIGENTLQTIKVMWCNPSVATSAKKIQEEQMEYCNDGLRIYIHPKVWDLESSP